MAEKPVSESVFRVQSEPPRGARSPANRPARDANKPAAQAAPLPRRSTSNPASPLEVWWFGTGLWLLLLSWSVLSLAKTRWEINATIPSSLSMIAGMLFLLTAAVLGWGRSGTWLSPESRAALGLLLLWGVVTTVRSLLDFQWLSVRNALGNRYFAFAWLVPAVLVLGGNPALMRQLLAVMVNQGWLGLLVVLIGLAPAINWFTDFQMTWGCSAALIFWQYLPKWSRGVALVGALLHIALQAMASSRNEMLGHGMLLLAAGFVAVRRPGPRQATRSMGVFALSCLLAAAGYYVATHDSLPFAGPSTDARLAAMKQEFWVNTRASDEYNVYRDLLDELATPTERAIGRGVLGTYRSASAMMSRDAGNEMSSYHAAGEKSSGMRQVIECGYLYIILKGGMVMLLLMLALIVPALWLGLVRSNNWCVRGFAFVIGAWLVEMVPFGLPCAFPRYVLFWFAVGVCLSPSLRKLSDLEMERALGLSSAARRLNAWRRGSARPRRGHPMRHLRLKAHEGQSAGVEGTHRSQNADEA